MPMFIKWLCATLCAVAFVVACVSSSYAQNQNAPIARIDVVVKKQPAGTAIFKGTTDSKGEVTVKELPAGRYMVVLTAKPGTDGGSLMVLDGSVRWRSCPGARSRRPTSLQPIARRKEPPAPGRLTPPSPRMAKSYKLSLT
jgi:hypothetical protein